ncbi:YbgC/FadM family acyl-CoA thioesterase [Helicobacter saguini]|uniref:YbgC/FadM family acyl-CoA thioesterase n=1 Tax=Helicobacter saguini TaxID=1548018 RepID=A0A347VQL0_9HELI|nr:YbgC/FadM family acyl-CoA thioesterase [Helicobacter saguini]MWV60907.1 YbgC/FadM family acyl-CoA thioesterase [Helicobacter saguini]MWV68425.1 YbgC/FadM family acyl-CoA thioesterase [Helicobacter saguini]MWV70111.1 YbgC/FadM family acyl-CoA thioesterase [Helicobacter saguini]MWV72014.1 YbgC/FadM family acyl-CoA thioesterase [Helicobacter saguini]TLD93762.1 YbgC/FadM family acyl-CoA thioesterase [Helicobacter saguini]
MTNYVFYDDTDCGGIVYHSNYITFCERARSYIFFENGIFPHEISSEESRGFVVRSVDSKFFYPLQFADKYEVKSKVLELKHTSLNVRQEIFKIDSINAKNKIESPILSFCATINLAYIDLKTKKPSKIPEHLREILLKYL